MRALTTTPGRSASDRRRVALYSHDTMGVGHVRRNLLIAQALVGPPASTTVLLIAGAKEATAFALPTGADCLTLPALYKTPDGAYQSRALGLSLPELVGLRARAITAALRAFDPDVLVVDKEPRGAVSELGPALRALKARGRTRCVLGLRDVLDDPAAVRREWAAAANEEAVRDYYEAVWVYGDPAVYDVVAECDLGPAVGAKATYTGYLDPCARLAAVPGGDDPDLPLGRFALCTVGGGQDGARVAEAFAAARRSPGLGAVVVTGPYMPADARDRLHRCAAADPGLRVREFVPEPCRLLCRADRVVTMGGYNTVCEVLAFKKPALVVPRVVPRREQLIRAERLRDLGLLDVLHPDAVTPTAVARWLAADAPAPDRRRIDLDGLRRLPALVDDLLANAPLLPPIQSARVEVRHAAS